MRGWAPQHAGQQQAALRQARFFVRSIPVPRRRAAPSPRREPRPPAPCAVSTMAMPRKMKTPSPPPPMAAAMVAVPMVATVAMRSPATIEGTASGSSTCQRIWRGGHAHRDGGFAHRGVHAEDADQGVAQDRQQRVEAQRDDRGALADAADERQRHQKAEQRQAGDGLRDIGEAQAQRRAPGAPA